MSKYIGTKAVNLSTTSADVTGNADIDGNLTVGGNLTVSGTTITVDHATAQTVDLGDNDKIRLGDDNDLQIYHNGTHNIIQSNEGNITIETTSDDRDIFIKSDDGSGGSATYLQVDGSTGSINLRHYGGVKLATSSTGVDITGSGVFSNSTDVAQSFAEFGRTPFSTHGSFLVSGTGTGHLTSNTDASGNSTVNVNASRISIENGDILFLRSPSTAAGSARTFTEYMKIDSAGRVKIGTTSNTPAGDGVAGFVFGDNTAGTPATGVASFAANSSAPLLLTRLGSDGNVLGIADGTTTRGILRVVSSNLAIQGNNNLVFSTGGSNTERMRIESGGDVKVENNLTVKNQKAIYFDNTGGYSPRLSNASDQSALSSFINNSESLRLNSSCLSIFSSGQFANTYGNSTRTNLQIDGSGEAILTMSIGGTMAGYVNAGTTDMVVAAKTGSRIRLIPNGSTANEVQITTGGSIVMKNGAGIDFSASEGSGATSSLLDDYEEGTWSPASGNGSNPLSVMGSGNRYTKIGRQVIAYFDITWNSGNSTASAANITGLPFTPSSNHEGDGAATIGYITGSAGVDFVAHVSNSNPSFNFYPDGSSGSANYSALAGRRIAGYIQYYTNA